jgi:hypothetical protein
LQFDLVPDGYGGKKAKTHIFLLSFFRLKAGYEFLFIKVRLVCGKVFESVVIDIFQIIFYIKIY